MTQVLRALLITLVLAIAVSAALWLVQGDVTGLRRPALAFFETWWGGVPPENAMAKTFESVASREAMDKMRKLYERQLGAYESAGDTLEEWAREDEGHVSIELVFERGTGIGRWEFVREAGQWKVRRFHIDLPRSAVPKTDSTDPRIFTTRLLERWAQGYWEVVWEQFSADLRTRVPSADFGKRTKAWADAAGTLEKVVVNELEDEGEQVRGSFELVYPEGIRHKARLELIWEGGRWYVDRFEVETFA